MDREEIIKSWYKDWLENIQSVHSIFVHTYGEDRVDLQYTPEEDFISSNSTRLSVISEEHLGEESTVNTIREELFSEEIAIIIILWPEIIIENEKNQSHRIKEFYAKIEVNGHGRLSASPVFSRAHYSRREWFRDYAHSHLPGIPSRSTSTWANACFGTGPINRTISALVVANDWELWMLLAVQLDQFVHVESLAGVPYRQLNTLAGSTQPEKEYKFHFWVNPLGRLSPGNPVIHLDTMGFTMEHLQEFAKEFCLRFPKLGLFIRYDNSFYNWGSPFVDTVTTMSDLFIKWFNNKKLLGEITVSFDELISLGILKRSVLDGNSLETVVTTPINLREQDYVPYIGRRLGFFKGESISIKIDLKEEPTEVAPNTLVVLNTGIVLAILTSILKTINIYHGFGSNFNPY